MNQNYDTNKIIIKILREEKERQEAVAKLKQEMREIEAQGEMRDTKRISEIIDELNIIAPPIEDIENENNSEPEPVYKPKKKRRSRLLKIFAACVILIITVPTITITSLNTNLWSETFAFTRRLWITLTGGGIIQDNAQRIGVGTRVYRTVEEFEAAQGVRILVPAWLPGDIEIESIHYYVERGEISLFYSDEISWLRIDLNTAIPDTDGAEIYKSNGIVFYLFKDLNIILWEYEGNFYNLTLGFCVSGYAERIIENIKNN